MEPRPDLSVPVVGLDWLKRQLVINIISFSLIYQMLKLSISWILTQRPEDSSKLFRCNMPIWKSELVLFSTPVLDFSNWPIATILGFQVVSLGI